MMKQELGEKDLADKYFTRWKNKVFKGKKKKKKGKKKDKKSDKNQAKTPKDKNGKQDPKTPGKLPQLNSIACFKKAQKVVAKLQYQ